MLNSRQKAMIGFGFIINGLETSSPYGEELKRHPIYYTPSRRGELIAQRANLSALIGALRADDTAASALERCFMQLKDIRRSIERCGEFTLSEVELFEIKRFLLQLELISSHFSELCRDISLININIRPFPDALELLDPDGLHTSAFYISDRLSPLLSSLRKQHKLIELRLRELKSTAPSEAETLKQRRNELFVLEENEELRVRGELSRALAPFARELLQVTASIGELDFALAKARLAVRYGAVIPQIADDGRAVLDDMFNPMISASVESRGGSFTPISIALEGGATVITGANMGGKSVAVKTLALNAALAQYGFPVFCSRARLPLFEDIFLFAEDMEDGSGGLSSFGGEMVEFNSMLSRALAAEGGANLILMDEFARGTNPQEGAALVRAAVRCFNAHSARAMAVLTTHFDGVARFAKAHYQVMGLKNAGPAALKAAFMSADKARAANALMDFGLYPVAPDTEPPRDAIAICRVLGVNGEFMSFVDQEGFLQ